MRLRASLREPEREIGHIARRRVRRAGEEVGDLRRVAALERERVQRPRDDRRGRRVVGLRRRRKLEGALRRRHRLGDRETTLRELDHRLGRVGGGRVRDRQVVAELDRLLPGGLHLRRRRLADDLEGVELGLEVAGRPGRRRERADQTCAAEERPRRERDLPAEAVEETGSGERAAAEPAELAARGVRRPAEDAHDPARPLRLDAKLAFGLHHEPNRRGLLGRAALRRGRLVAVLLRELDEPLALLRVRGRVRRGRLGDAALELLRGREDLLRRLDAAARVAVELERDASH